MSNFEWLKHVKANFQLIEVEENHLVGGFNHLEK